ncbi:hypothetical protein FV242_21480 [Methylobacterium sp. WL64]|uniref:hypothetical protein n=1 Tax=Methylobacterium sp. WL64 TaxID=2603894 RepID=UPI0011CAED5B|nr:hypothetical protein [Methylobacterium sp. WL64]TXN00567.1 hypothetical protein FV242_21480 [Methylobacterium sp. WL64]
MNRRDLAPIIARVLVEHPPTPMGTTGYLHWAHETWPDCTDEEVLRALEIADELFTVDCMMRGA